MADITSKAAIVPVTPKAASSSGNGAAMDNNNQGAASTAVAAATTTGDPVPASSSGFGGSSGFNSLPSSIHHGLSERLHGLTEKLHALGGGSGSSAGNGGEASADQAPRSRTSSLGTRERFGIHLEGGGGSLFPLSAPRAVKSSQGSPTKTHSSSRNSSKKSNQSQLITNGKLDGK